ncbi:MAG TPA: alkaline phosphatase family protein [Terriglobales bacterium]|nr:alkaline phosphatase family protein [Terriglobales bacterium]
MFGRWMAFLLAATFLASSTAVQAGDWGDDDHGGIRHVLLISIDGMHSLDFVNCANGVAGANGGKPYCPNLAALGKNGVNYLNASTSRPSDSFPGLMAIVSGGSPRTVGAFYDVAYDRVLAPPTVTTGNGVAGGTCTPGVANGTTTEYEEGIDKDQTLLSGGGNFSIGSIDPAKLIRDPFNNCKPVYPWNFVRTNTIFGVVHQAGGFAAWSDKHPAYSSVAGPGDGSNLDDYYAPEINSNVVPLNVTTPEGMKCNPIPDPTVTSTSQYTDSFQEIRCYDTLKVNAILNEINGMTLMGNAHAPVPTLFGMNFQAVSVGQKLIEKKVGTGGYTDAAGTPTPLIQAQIQFVDDSIGEMVSQLKQRGLYNSTLIVITAKHGQSPIDPNRFFPIPGHSGNNGNSPATILDGLGLIPSSESPSNPTGIGPTEDDVSLLWLNPGSDIPSAVKALEENASQAGIGEIFYGPSLTTMFNKPGIPPQGDPRTPDIIVTPNYGVVYTGSSKKQAEHGGFSHDDTNVILLVSNPSFRKATVNSPVQTAQVAPTILKALGLNPYLLQSVQIEGTPVLPAVPFRSDER